MSSTLRRTVAALAVTTLALAACSTPAPVAPGGGGGIYQSQTARGARLDKQAAADMISELRRGKGLPPVMLDATLNRMAEEQAAAMARTGKLSHSGSAGTFRQRIAASGYRNGGMWENVGAGHDTLADAFTGWRSSPSHLKNMLQPGATRIGIAATPAPGTRYEVFWTLVLADPHDPRPSQTAAIAPVPAGATASDPGAQDEQRAEAAAAAARQIPPFRPGAPGQIAIGF